MGVKKNAYLEKQRADKKAFMNSVELIVKQYCIDTLNVTLNEDKYGWGYDRQMQLMADWEANRKKYQNAINPDHPEADLEQEHIDRILKQIIRGKKDLIPFEERYPTLKKIKY